MSGDGHYTDPVTLDGAREERRKSAEALRGESADGDETASAPGKLATDGEGNLWSSRIAGAVDRHAPAIDVDVPLTVVPSSTPGHSHLYVGVECSWDDYLSLLRALAACGIVEDGYVGASEARGMTLLRKPGVRKGAE